MPKVPSFPTLLDEVKTISIGKLNRWGYILSGKTTVNSIFWTDQNGEYTGSIGVRINEPKRYISLSYTCNKEPIDYKVGFTSVPSNLGKGKVYYFICPKTRKRCRKLYLIDKYFVHRETFTNCMYNTQTKSKYTRLLDANYGAFLKKEELYESLNGKHFKKTYAGKPTKKYLKIMKQIKKGENISWDQIGKLLMV